MTLVAVLGGGQLGRMLALAGIPMGLRFRFLDPDPDAPSGAVGELVVGAYDDEAKLARLVAGAQVATFEFENVPARALAWLEAHRAPGFEGVFPGRRSLETAQDRLLEKRCFEALGIAVPRWQAVDSAEDLAGGVAAVGLPAVLKTRRLGYDGKGQAVLRSAGDAAPGFARIGSAPAIVESLVPFRRELSVIAARGRDGSVVEWPIVENTHLDGILATSRPLDADDPLAGVARRHAAALLRRLEHVGVLCVEFFDLDGTLLANEFAPRVHNSGHWTIEGSVTSQFANHLRAVLGLPLGETTMRRPVAMVNLVGALPEPGTLLALPGAALHRYGKAPRARRKVGHVTVEADDPAQLASRLDAVRAVATRAGALDAAGA